MICFICFVLNFIFGLFFCVSFEVEEIGFDDVELGEFVYDYVEFSRYVNDVFVGGSVVGSVKELNEVFIEKV